MSKASWYQEHKAELAEQQAGKSRQEIAEALQTKAEHVFDPATAPKVKHNWVHRGLKLSCEGAGHPHHQAWKPGSAPM
jgi:hypothetical protein